jgi:hypothetical protein
MTRFIRWALFALWCARFAQGLFVAHMELDQALHFFGVGCSLLFLGVAGDSGTQHWG